MLTTGMQKAGTRPTSDSDLTSGFSTVLARRALMITLVAAWLGAAIGLIAARLGTVVGQERTLVLCSLVFSSGSLLTLLLFRRVPLQTSATVSTICFSINLCAGIMIAAFGSGEPLNLFVYLVWFFPLLVFNKLVNGPAVGRFLAKFILVAPLLSIVCILPRSISIFKTTPLTLMAVYCLSYLGFGIMLDVVTRYREEFIVERERTQSLKLAAEVLESISDCFVSLDTNFRLIYLNDAACAEFAVERQLALNDTLENVAPSFLSHSLRTGINRAFSNSGATIFEARHNERDIWYVVRCYPRANGMSIYFQNITESVLARRELERAQDSVREKAELLDKAQDAIFVVDMDYCFRYWNKSAERLYGYKSTEVIGRPVAGILNDDHSELSACLASVMRDGDWAGEISRHREDGTTLTVESHLTLVENQDGRPQSILAINTDITRRKEVEAQMQRLAFYDTLTQLPNRQLLRERLDRALTVAPRQKSTGALLFIDLDDFKTLNDSMGHHIGDLLLQQVAIRLTSCTRKTDTVARLGGDEFVVMLEGLSQDDRRAAAAAKLIADKILESFRQPYDLGPYKHESTASIGIALFNGSSDTADDLLKRADLAMYRAKSQGRNALCFFDPEMQTYVTSRAALRSDLRRALQNGEFELFYQPQVNNNGHVVGAEALVRWRHPQRGIVPPGEFIPLAEDAGLIVELGGWILQTACLQLAKWADSPEMKDLCVAVNVSLRQLLDSQFVNVVLEVLRKSEANPRRLKLEITESSMLEKLEDTIAKIEALKLSGIRFSLDDFGTGYSSLSHVKRLPLDELKVDRAFVSDLLSNDKVASIARTIVKLGQNLNLKVIAEGVETEGQREFLEREGCLVYQGFLYSPALCSSQFETFVAAQHKI
jgi:diguanylate cyclase (GGDEF)-like protein/PAS domain S-box-containing protein